MILRAHDTQSPSEMLPATTHDLLETVLLLDTHGGASVQLAAWDLGLETAAILEAWQELIALGLIVRAEVDPVFGERLYRLTPDGTTVLASLAGQARPER